MEVTKWYFDSWAVRDGAAFASKRQPILSGNLSPSESSVFVCVPDLVPIPVGRLSIGLSATRHQFQLGFWENEQEVAFDSLEQIIEAVRIGYLGGGLGPGAVGITSPEGPSGGVDDNPKNSPENDPDSPGSKHYEDFISSKDLDKNWGSDQVIDNLKVLSDAARFSNYNNAQQSLLPLHKTFQDLRDLVQAYAEAITIAWIDRIIRNNTPEQRSLIRYWIHILLINGFWKRGNEFWEFIDRYLYLHFDHLYPYDEFYLWLGRVRRDYLFNPIEFEHFLQTFYRKFWLSQPAEITLNPIELVWVAPCPRRTTWAKRINRLADKLILPFCDRDYYLSNANLPELAPAVLAIIVKRSSKLSLHPEENILEQVIGDSLKWMAQELPTIKLPEIAENILSEYIWNQVSDSNAPDNARTL